MTLEPGIHEGIAAELYHGADITDEPSLSASIAKVLLTRSPLHAWHAHPRLNPQHEAEHSDKFALGTAAHLLFLQGEKFAEQVSTIDATDWRTSAAKAHKEAARAAGLTPLLLKDWQRVVEMVGAIRDQLAARDDDPPMFDAAGKPEQTLIWREPNGVLCRSRLDWLHDSLSYIDDLKTTSASANPHAWSQRTLWNIGADIQVAFHLRGLRAVQWTDKGRPAWGAAQFRYCVVETTPPYALSVVTLGFEALKLANEKVEAAIEAWKNCLETDVWPAYTKDVYEADPPPWSESDWLDQQEIGWAA